MSDTEYQSEHRDSTPLEPGHALETKQLIGAVAKLLVLLIYELKSGWICEITNREKYVAEVLGTHFGWCSHCFLERVTRNHPVGDLHEQSPRPPGPCCLLYLSMPSKVFELRTSRLGVEYATRHNTNPVPVSTIMLVNLPLAGIP